MRLIKALISLGQLEVLRFFCSSILGFATLYLITVFNKTEVQSGTLRLTTLPPWP
jgi:hypothetical protein